MRSNKLAQAFLLDPSVTFLNHGSFGARPLALVEEAERIRREIEAGPVEFLGRRSSALLEGALAELGAYLGAPPADLAFVENATTAINAVARSARLGPGDEVLGSDHEYGACELAWKRACSAAGAVYRRFSVPLPYAGDEDFLARLEAAITPRTRVLFLSHITSPTALRFPAQAACRLARERGILSVIDGAHVPGHLPLDLGSLGADYYAGNCHKWLCAPLGSAFLHVRPEHQAGLEPLVTSWGLVAEAEGTAAHDGYVGTTALARRLRWLGTRDPSAFLAVPAALRYARGLAMAGDGERCAELAAGTARRAAELLGLEPLVQEGSGLRMALAPLPPCDAGAVKAALFDRYRVEIPATSYGGASFLRLSFFAYNDESDAEALLGALRELFPGR
ncbi:MAG TPA: aminotransferase class V-fold PLP-dependent enzyme [Spirochaetia bacterium]|nr:aminotransferase class V-fold PLP-dependent enzyme [Spirochaetia bacterium]